MGATKHIKSKRIQSKKEPYMPQQGGKLLLRDFFKGNSNCFLNGLQPTLGFSFKSESIETSDFEQQVTLRSQKVQVLNLQHLP